MGVPFSLSPIAEFSCLTPYGYFGQYPTPPPAPRLKKGEMRLKTKLSWVLVFVFFTFVVKTVWKQVFLITTNKRDQLSFTYLKRFLINFSGLIFRYWPWLLWHNLLYSMSYLQWTKDTVWCLVFQHFYQGH